MRILQLIDSLDAGGAERVAVNFANSLVGKVAFSALATTRKEGVLKSEVASGVGYVFLEKSGKLGLKACRRLKRYCESEKITHIHAHGTSFFTALMVKLMASDIKLIWHNHNGRSQAIKGLRLQLMRFASKRFSGILSVNEKLDRWAIDNLCCRTTAYLANFVAEPQETQIPNDLNGQAGKRILCVANLRTPKGHMTLLRAMEEIARLGWTLHLVGKDSQDGYSEEIKAFIGERNLGNVIYLYGARQDASAFVSACDICVLSSDAEGLPLALLEYGIRSKPVVVTAVGEIPNMIRNGENGFVVPAGNPKEFAQALQKLIQDEELRATFGKAFQKTVIDKFSETVVIDRYLKWLKDL
ncbi:glycosyltransferase [Flavobacterium sp.]|uniref:glycosyltransferase n=1 Tax=Flavobacterium sp. TaxID=239 RepID=UPI0025BA59D4|nr:glycosyltransferase [Flavobacterium sp.]